MLPVAAILHIARYGYNFINCIAKHGMHAENG